MSSRSSIVIEEKPAYVQPQLGRWHKNLLLTLFCLAEFVDAFSNSALFPAQPAFKKALNMQDNELTWMFSAYSAAFAAFLLISGRVSDIYSSKWTFIVGSALVGLFSLGCGFVKDKVGMFVLRGLMGVAAAATVPSGLSLIIEWFPDPHEQNFGISMFGGSSALGNVLGIVLGGIFTQWVSWKWIFYFITILGVPIAVISILSIPPSGPREKPSFRKLDLPGVILFTASVMLFIYAVTSGSVNGWGSANVISTLVVSILAMAGFFTLEAWLPEEIASLPPKIWKYPNIPVLMLCAYLPFFWWTSLFYSLMDYFQTEYHWDTILTAIRFLPTGTFSAPIGVLGGMFPKYIDIRYSILIGMGMELVATILLPFADTRERYWSLMFPAFIIGTIGTMTVFTQANIGVFMNTPPRIAGVVGAIFNVSLQLGLALGLAILTSIRTSIEKKKIQRGEHPGYTGIADGYWFVFAWVAVTAVLFFLFYKKGASGPPDEEVVAPASGDAESERTKNESREAVLKQ
ncbi:major facilitator superfamily domain-containing protein [Cantharellus anzutake]|uniref:major facilitator superfamily domain-containing protein n=1 Tax=Cantharellus anzutake TaxID=1750568 RepID=UPI00190481B9|nr:major facilitator superfamily domain-containing protein [Cantharellus anzutake]KAF8330309.1 major facilitator superfamily domain-containing protein [Cantharellus anzutake]